VERSLYAGNCTLGQTLLTTAIMTKENMRNKTDEKF
jgi:hypothetical protein